MFRFLGERWYICKCNKLNGEAKIKKPTTATLIWSQDDDEDDKDDGNGNGNGSTFNILNQIFMVSVGCIQKIIT